MPQVFFFYKLRSDEPDINKYIEKAEQKIPQKYTTYYYRNDLNF